MFDYIVQKCPKNILQYLFQNHEQIILTSDLFKHLGLVPCIAKEAIHHQAPNGFSRNKTAPYNDVALIGASVWIPKATTKSSPTWHPKQNKSRKLETNPRETWSFQPSKTNVPLKKGTTENRKWIIFQHLIFRGHVNFPGSKCLR